MRIAVGFLHYFEKAFLKKVDPQNRLQQGKKNQRTQEFFCEIDWL